MTVSAEVWLPDTAFELKFIHASGPGGQHVNKTATAVELRVQVAALNLGYGTLKRLREQQGRRINKQDILVIQADSHRSQLKNRKDAWRRLDAMIAQAKQRPKPRVATKPTKAAKKRRMDSKKIRGKIKNARKKPTLD